MKRVMFPLVVTMTFVISGIGYADNQTATITPTSTINPASTTNTKFNAATIKSGQADTAIKLYDEPNNSAKVLGSLNINQRLVPIFQKDGWIKVGNPTDGTVGWINKDEYQQAIDAAIHQNVQTIYIEQIDKNGKKPQITVYQNGKKLTGDQAQAIYTNIKKQQQEMQKNMQIFQQRMNSWMNQQMQVMNTPMLAFPAMPVLQPVVIVENPTSTNVTDTSKETAKK